MIQTEPLATTQATVEVNTMADSLIHDSVYAGDVLMADSLYAEQDSVAEETIAPWTGWDQWWKLGSMEYLNDTTLQHTELPFRPHGLIGDSYPYHLWRDNWVGGALIVCLLFLVYVVNHARNSFNTHITNFFQRPKEQSSLFAEETAIESLTMFCVFFTLSVLGGLVTYFYAHESRNLFFLPFPAQWLIGIYSGCFLTYFILRRWLSRFVNWVFFEKYKQKIWRESCDFLTTAEFFVSFPLVCIFVYFDISLIYVAIILCFVLFLEKFLLAFKCYSIFFPNLYCLFHLFAYLCALELMPMLTLWKVMLYITDNLIIKY